MKSLLKRLIPKYLDQIIFKGWANSILLFDKKSNSKTEKEKYFNICFILLVTIGELYYKDGSEWYFEKVHILDSSLIKVYENLYDYCKY